MTLEFGFCLGSFQELGNFWVLLADFLVKRFELDRLLADDSETDIAAVLPDGENPEIPRL